MEASRARLREHAVDAEFVAPRVQAQPIPLEFAGQGRVTVKRLRKQVEIPAVVHGFLELTREFLDARVIAMTGASGEQNFLSVAKLFGARHILEKPFGADQIRRLVNYTLAH